MGCNANFPLDKFQKNERIYKRFSQRGGTWRMLWASLIRQKAPSVAFRLQCLFRLGGGHARHARRLQPVQQVCGHFDQPDHRFALRRETIVVDQETQTR